jgi:hypothetical protein
MSGPSSDTAKPPIELRLTVGPPTLHYFRSLQRNCVPHVCLINRFDHPCTDGTVFCGGPTLLRLVVLLHQRDPGI